MADKIILTKEMTIAEAIKLKPAIAGLLMSKGMHCLGCVIAQGETIGQAAEVHGLDPDELIGELNATEKKGK
jgi:hybrid cluster-associated redox disulfide protein